MGWAVFFSFSNNNKSYRMKITVSESTNLELSFENSQGLSEDKQQAIKDINLIARDSGLNIKLV